MVYNVGAAAMQHLGRRRFLALYLLGGTFAQGETIDRLDYYCCDGFFNFLL